MKMAFNSKFKQPGVLPSILKYKEHPLSCCIPCTLVLAITHLLNYLLRNITLSWINNHDLNPSQLLVEKRCSTLSWTWKCSLENFTKTKSRTKTKQNNRIDNASKRQSDVYKILLKYLFSKYVFCHLFDFITILYYFNRCHSVRIMSVRHCAVNTFKGACFEIFEMMFFLNWQI